MPWNTNLYGTPLNIAAYTGAQLRVVAGPGTGKTYALMRRVARLLEQIHAVREEAGTFLGILLDVADQFDEEAFERIIVAGAGSFRETTLSLTPPPGASGAFTVRATAASDAQTSGSATGELTVAEDSGLAHVAAVRAPPAAAAISAL